MLDPILRRLVGPPLDWAGRWFARRGATANQTTLAALAIGMMAVPLLAGGHYGSALAVILVNRLLDGLDGAIARHVGSTAFGGYLDIVCDMVFYAAVPLGFGLAVPANAIWAALLLASFVCTSASFLGRAIMAAQRREADAGQRGQKSFFYSPGLIEGTETIAAFVLFCMFPSSFSWLAGALALLCFLTAFLRVAESFFYSIQ